ncbi:MAG: DUF2188 domain-containing protein [Lewinellaceae bacterium]|nr:DUF2188 domain-containing protein [Saprospiraceae bacterium]MCB9316061.1 DUF2188 domain-containing protein [Lewinellaceae bacterium]
MTDIKTSNFWLDLLKKILRIILKGAGVRTGPATHHQHVVPHPEGWAVKGEGNAKYTAVYEYQEDAIERAKDIARNYGADVIIHRKDGSIRDRINYR